MPSPGRLIALAVLVTICGGITACGSGAQRRVAGPRALVYGRTSAQARETARRPVAIIGERTITQGELQHWIAVAARTKAGAPEPPTYTACIVRQREILADAEPQEARLKSNCEREYEQLLQPALATLIHDQWLIGEAAARGFSVDRRKLKREAAPNGPHENELRDALANTVETAADFELILMVSQISDYIYRKLERAVPPITAARTSEYYRHHERGFLVPERRDLYILRTSSETAAKKAKWEIEHGTSFASAVNKTSLLQPNTSHEGLLLGLTPHDFGEPPINKAIFAAPLKTLSGPVRISLGYYVFEVIRSIPAHQQTLAEATPQIRKELHRELRDHLVTHFVARFRKRWTAKTNCLPGYIVKHCRQFWLPKANYQGYANVL